MEAHVARSFTCFANLTGGGRGRGPVRGCAPGRGPATSAFFRFFFFAVPKLRQGFRPRESQLGGNPTLKNLTRRDSASLKRCQVPAGGKTPRKRRLLQKQRECSPPAALSVFAFPKTESAAAGKVAADLVYRRRVARRSAVT